MKLFLFVFSLALAAVPSSACDAKCIYENHTVRGTINDTSGDAVPAATVIVRWSDRVGAEKNTVATHTDHSGNYEAHVQFYTWNGSDSRGSDECKATLDTVHVHIEARGYVPLEVKLPIQAESTTGNYELTSIQ